MKSCFEGDAEATAAVRQIGTNAIPSLTKWLLYEPSKMKLRMVDACEKLPCKIQIPLRDFIGDRLWKVRPDLATYGFSLLGPEAKPAIPELVRALALYQKQSHDNYLSFRRTFIAASVFRSVGEDSLPPLVTVMTNRANPKELRIEAVRWISSIRIFNSFAISNLVQCLQDPERDVAMTAAFTLAGSKLEPDMVIPFLTNAVHSIRSNEHDRREAVEYLGHYGQTARMALPTLIELMSDPSERVRKSVPNAIADIAPEVLNQTSAASN
jgi:HEAT repeat protein